MPKTRDSVSHRAKKCQKPDHPKMTRSRTAGKEKDTRIWMGTDKMWVVASICHSVIMSSALYSHRACRSRFQSSIGGGQLRAGELAIS
jgi:hypothetical protein